MAKKILFICDGNGLRSPVAEQLFKNIFSGKGYEVSSAGMSDRFAGQTIREIVAADILKNLKELKVDVAGHVCKMLNEGLLSQSDFIFVMQKRQQKELSRKFPQYQSKIFTLKEFAGCTDGIDLPDHISTSIALSLQFYAEVKDALEKIKEKNLLERKTMKV